jgi:hypothetical protein
MATWCAEGRLVARFEYAVRGRLARGAAARKRPCDTLVAPHALRARARSLTAQFRLADYLPDGEFPVHNERDALRALMRGLDTAVLGIMEYTFLTSYSLVSSSDTSDAYFVEFNLWTPGAHAALGGAHLFACPLTAYRSIDTEPWTLVSAAAPQSATSCDWHAAVQELFSLAPPGELRRDFETLESACLSRTHPAAAETARRLWDWLLRKKENAAAAREEAAATTRAVVHKVLEHFEEGADPGLHMLWWRWCDHYDGAHDDESAPVALYKLCTVDASQKARIELRLSAVRCALLAALMVAFVKQVVLAPERPYKDLSPAERAFINSPSSGSKRTPEAGMFDATQKTILKAEAKLARLAALSDEEYERLEWLFDACEELVVFFKEAEEAYPPRVAPADEDEPADEDAPADEDEPSALGWSDKSPFDWDSDAAVEPDAVAHHDAKRRKRSGSVRRTCKMNWRTGKRCGSALKTTNSVWCACDGGSACCALTKHADTRCTSGSHIRCLPEESRPTESNPLWICDACAEI